MSYLRSLWSLLQFLGSMGAVTAQLKQDYNLMPADKETPKITPDNPIKVYLDGNAWCALWGENLQEGVAEFGSSPEDALNKLCDRLFERDTLDSWITKPL